jgi:hypothetical protein
MATFTIRDDQLINDTANFVRDATKDRGTLRFIVRARHHKQNFQARLFLG